MDSVGATFDGPDILFISRVKLGKEFVCKVTGSGLAAPSVVPLVAMHDESAAVTDAVLLNPSISAKSEKTSIKGLRSGGFRGGDNSGLWFIPAIFNISWVRTVEVFVISGWRLSFTPRDGLMVLPESANCLWRFFFSLPKLHEEGLGLELTVALGRASSSVKKPKGSGQGPISCCTAASTLALMLLSCGLMASLAADTVKLLLRDVEVGTEMGGMEEGVDLSNNVEEGSDMEDENEHGSDILGNPKVIEEVSATAQGVNPG